MCSENKRLIAFALRAGEELIEREDHYDLSLETSRCIIITSENLVNLLDLFKKVEEYNGENIHP